MPTIAKMAAYNIYKDISLSLKLEISNEKITCSTMRYIIPYALEAAKRLL